MKIFLGIIVGLLFLTFLLWQVAAWMVNDSHSVRAFLSGIICLLSAFGLIPIFIGLEKEKDRYDQ